MFLLLICTDFTHCSGVPIADLEHVNTGIKDQAFAIDVEVWQLQQFRYSYSKLFEVCFYVFAHYNQKT